MAFAQEAWVVVDLPYCEVHRAASGNGHFQNRIRSSRIGLVNAVEGVYLWFRVALARCTDILSFLHISHWSGDLLHHNALNH